MKQKFPCHFKPSFLLPSGSYLNKSLFKSPKNPPKGFLCFDVAISITILRNFFHEAFLVILSFFALLTLFDSTRKKNHVVQLLSSTSNFLSFFQVRILGSLTSRNFSLFSLLHSSFYTLIVLGNHEKISREGEEKNCFWGGMTNGTHKIAVDIYIYSFVF